MLCCSLGGPMRPTLAAALSETTQDRWPTQTPQCCKSMGTYCRMSREEESVTQPPGGQVYSPSMPSLAARCAKGRKNDGRHVRCDILRRPPALDRRGGARRGNGGRDLPAAAAEPHRLQVEHQTSAEPDDLKPIGGKPPRPCTNATPETLPTLASLAVPTGAMPLRGDAPPKMFEPFRTMAADLSENRTVAL